MSRYLIDNNECTLNTDGCQQLCVNTVGSFRCDCNSGYTLDSNGITCSGKLDTEYIHLNMTRDISILWGDFISKINCIMLRKL